MPIDANGRNVIDLYNRRNNVQQQTQRTVTNPVNNDAGTVTEMEVHVAPNIYRQYLPNMQQVNLTSARANDSEAAMREVYNIDREAFANLDPYDSYEEFKNFVAENNMSTYVVKDDDNAILGYYQLEPVKDGDLYIDSIGLKPEYRNSRKGYQAIKYSWQKILDYARENNVQTLSLHVDSTNRNLVRMYQSLGFTIAETYNNYYENGAGAYFMTKPVNDVQQEPAQDAVSEIETEQTDVEAPLENSEEINETGQSAETETSEVQEAETSQEEAEEPAVENADTELVRENQKELEKQRAIEEYNQKIFQAKEELLSSGVPEETVNRWSLDFCVKPTDKWAGKKVFDNDRFTAIKYLIDFENRYKDNEKVYPHSTENYHHHACKIINALEVKDESGEHLQMNVLPYLNRFAQKGIRVSYYNDIINAAKLKDKSGNTYISGDMLDFAADIAPYVKEDYYLIDDIMKECRLKTKDGIVFSEEAANCVNRPYLLTNLNHFDARDAENLLSASKTTDEKGYETFDYALFQKLFSDTTDIDRYKNLIPYSSAAKDLKENGVDIWTYLTYGNLFSEFCRLHNVQSLDYNEKRKFEYEAFKACCCDGNHQTYHNGHQVSVKGFDRASYNALLKALQKIPPDFEVKKLPEIIKACRTKTESYSDEKFDEALYEKALLLKSLGTEDDEIPKILEACKLVETDTYFHEGKIEKKIFSDEIFNLLPAIANAEKAANNDGWKIIPLRGCSDKIVCSKYTVNGREYFDKNIFDELTDAHPYVTSNYGPCALDFFYEYINRNYEKCKRFDIEKYKAYQEVSPYASLENVCETTFNDQTHTTTYMPSAHIIRAYKKLHDMNFPFTKRDNDDSSYNYPERCIIDACMTENGYHTKSFNPEAFRNAVNLLEKGIDGRDVMQIMYASRTYNNDLLTFVPAHFNKIVELIDNGMNAGTASSVVEHTRSGGHIIESRVNKCVELYNMGITNPHVALHYAGDDNLAYNRLKEAINRNLLPSTIAHCKENGEFKDGIYRLAVSLQDRGYTPEEINALLMQCYDKNTDDKEFFNREIFNNIKNLEETGISKENIANVLESCRSGKKFVPEAYEKVSLLHHKGFDDSGVSELLKKSYTDNKFSPEKYNQLLKLTSKIATLRDLTHNDRYIVEKLANYRKSIDTVTNTFGEDVMNNVLTQRIDGYIAFVNNSENLINKSSESFLADLKSRLDELPSPELKVKRLRVLGGLAGKVDENAMYKLVRMIESPKMTDEQIKLANEIFTDGTDYENQVKRFVEEMKVPAKYKKTVTDYLMKERLDKQVNYPKSIEEQQEQMDKFAQQMLTNPKIPLDKKIKYIDEFKAKKADMAANPEKYTTPEIFPKPLSGLKKVVTAYVNIPNDDAAFNSSVTCAMYSKYDIEPDESLLNEIHYDAKYFDKLLSPGSGFSDNFKKLITLKQLNPGKKMNEILVEMPEENSTKYEKYEKLGLIEQIKANLDTKRQFEENGVDFDMWNSFDETLKGETFTVEADPATEYNNVKYNLVNIFQDELFDKIKPEATDKLKQKLSENGYAIFNNKIYYNGAEIPDEKLDNFTNVVKNYIEKDDYWKSAHGNGSRKLTDEEIEGITGFTDHLKDAAARIKEIQGARTVNDISFRLADENDIGRNIFFGNHVSCCNSVDSNYAGFSAPLHLMNTYNRGIELVDRFGNSYGNSRCFFAMIDGKLTFVIDSFEANGKLASNPVVTDNLIKFAKQVCRSMHCPEANVVIGPNFNHINTSRLKRINTDKIKVLGTISAPTYCDIIGGKENIMEYLNNGVKNRNVLIYE